MHLTVHLPLSDLAMRINRIITVQRGTSIVAFLPSDFSRHDAVLSLWWWLQATQPHDTQVTT